MLRITVKFQQQNINVESMGSRKIEELIQRLINQLKLAPGTVYGLFMENTRLQNAQSFVENRVQTGAVLELKPANFGFVIVMNNNTPNFMHTDPDEQCEKLQNEVAAKISKPMNSFTLEFNGRMLEKQRPLKDYGIFPNSIINVVYKSHSGGQVNSNAQLTVRIYYSNQYFTLSLPGQTLISQIEQTIKQKFNITNEVYLTTQDGKQLQSQQPISSYNLPEKAELNLIVWNQDQNNQQSAPIQSQQQNLRISQQSAPLPQSNAQPLQYPPPNQPQQDGSRKIILSIEYQGVVQNIQVKNTILASELEIARQEANQINQPVQLISNGIPLISNQTLVQQGVQNGSRLILQIKPQQFASVPLQSSIQKESCVVAQIQPQKQPTSQTASKNFQTQKSIGQPLSQGDISNIFTDQQIPDGQLSDSKAAQQMAEQAAVRFKSEVNQIPTDQIIAQITIFSGQRSKSQILPQPSTQKVLLRRLMIIFNQQFRVIEFNSSIQIQDVEYYIKQRLGIDQPVQLIYDNQVLPSKQTIDELGIESESFLLLKINSQQPSSMDNMQTQQPENRNLVKYILRIQQMGSEQDQFYITTESDCKILSIEEQIRKKLNITKSIEFRFESTILPSDQSFDQLGLTKGSRITVQFRSQMEPQVQQQQTQKEQLASQDKIASERVIIQHGTIFFNVELTINVSIQELEKSFEQELQIYEPVGLIFNGQLLNSNQTLQQVGIKQGSTLVVQKKSQLQQTQLQTPSQQIPQLPQKLTLLLDYNGQVFNVELSRDTPISEIEDSMKQQLGLKQGVQVFQDHVLLMSNQTLQQLNIKNETQLMIQTIVPTQPSPSPTQKQNQEGKIIELIFNHQDQKRKIQVLDTTFVSQFEKDLKMNFGLTGQLTLYNNGQLLNQNMSLKEQNVIEGTILNIVNIFKPAKCQVQPQKQNLSQNITREKLNQFYIPNPDSIYRGPISRKLKIFIEDKKQTQLIVLYGNTLVFQLEEKLQKEKNIQLPINFLFQDLILPSNQTFDSLGLQTLSKLVMQIEPKLNMLIQEQKKILQSTILHSENLKLTIKYGFLILEVKFYSDAFVQQLEKLFEKELLIKEPINLIFNNKVLPSNLTLEQVGIKNTNSLIIETKSASQIRFPTPLKAQPEQIKQILLRIYFEGNYFPFQTNYSTLISEMKVILQKQLNLQNQLTLSLSNQELSSQLSVQQLNLKSNDVLVLVQIDKITITVNVQNEDLIFIVRSDSFVCDLMDLIKQKKKIYNRTELIYQKQKLIPQLSFKFQKVESGAHLLLVESQFGLDSTLIKLIN